MIPVLETERLLLREWRDSDFPAFASLVMDPVAARFITPCKSEGEAWRRMACFAGHWQLRGYGLWSVEAKMEDEPVGYCGTYFPVDWPEPEIGWGVYPAHQNRGYATEAARAAQAYSFDVLELTTAISLIAEGNQASVRVAEKIGAYPEKQVVFQGQPCTIFRHDKSTSPNLQSKENPTWQ